MDLSSQLQFILLSPTMQQCINSFCHFIHLIEFSASKLFQHRPNFDTFLFPAEEGSGRRERGEGKINPRVAIND